MRFLYLCVLFFPFFSHASERIDFNNQIKSLLSNRCIACHGPDEENREAGLRLDTFDGATRDLGGYSAIVPGDPGESEMMFRIISADDDDEVMPPKGKGEPVNSG